MVLSIWGFQIALAPLMAHTLTSFLLHTVWSFINQRDFFLVVMQAVVVHCDHFMHINHLMHINASCLGRGHNTTVFRNSSLPELME